SSAACADSCTRTFGISFGIRKFYINLLLKLFKLTGSIYKIKFGSERIKLAREAESNGEDAAAADDDEEEEEEDDSVFSGNGQVVTSIPNVESLKLIKKDSPRHLADGIKAESTESLEYTGQTDDSNKEHHHHHHHEFHLSDAFYFTKKGVEAIVDDEVTKRFSAEELVSWNLLTRTSMRYQYLGLRLTLLWGVAFLFRYFFLLPLRIIATVIGILYLMVASAVLGYLPDSRLKKWINQYVSLSVYKMLLRCIPCLVTFHNRENRAKGGGICVANHTSPIDVILLSSDNCYAFIGQKHTAFTGAIQRAMSRSGTDHIWFDRFEMRDRKKVSQRLKEHVEDPEKLPMLIFPEGTCINNTSVMMFKKGSFEIGGIIYPAAIKYDARFGDPFWNSSRFSMVRYIVMMLTSWAIVCDVWYLPPMVREEGEEAVDFANRVKAEIARQGGLVDLDWDGQLKRVRVKSTLREKEQEEYSKLIKND
ncbi:glycerol-3-phosphate acyltransferase 3-like, partial [Amphiura filiformis]|uniref:glycerol-3-phosphate acyltransferase 3-like n=1 Tax=Amphiura filiformis TaxID=82378 RepID=UPI003B21A9F5